MARRSLKTIGRKESGDIGRRDSDDIVECANRWEARRETGSDGSRGLMQAGQEQVRQQRGCNGNWCGICGETGHIREDCCLDEFGSCRGRGDIGHLHRGVKAGRQTKRCKPSAVQFVAGKVADANEGTGSCSQECGGGCGGSQSVRAVQERFDEEQYWWGTGGQIAWIDGSLTARVSADGADEDFIVDIGARVSLISDVFIRGTGMLLPEVVPGGNDLQMVSGTDVRKYAGLGADSLQTVDETHTNIGGDGLQVVEEVGGVKTCVRSEGDGLQMCGGTSVRSVRMYWGSGGDDLQRGGGSSTKCVTLMRSVRVMRRCVRFPEEKASKREMRCER
eukprot:m.275154 g.275154  ORF g.275154 m.275154 type:complete len:334 (+) comp40595_c0_seq5:914-1915(+)